MFSFFYWKILLILFCSLFWAEYADDAVGLELVTEPFIENLTQTLLKHFDIEPTTAEKTLTSSWKQAPKAETDKSKEESKDKKSGTKSSQESASKVTNISDTEKLTTETSSLPSKSVIEGSSQKLVETAQNSTQSDLAIMDSTASKLADSNSSELPVVVSSCAALNDAQKKQLADLHRQLLEPAASLKEVKTEDLVLPKVVNVEEERELNCLYKNINKIVSDDTKLVSVGEFLKGKLPLETVLSEGTVKLTDHLCKCFFVCKNLKEINTLLFLATASLKNLCVHQEKTVVECSVDFKLLSTEAIDGTPQTTESTVKPLPSFTPGDAFGIYSSNVLADVHTILTRTFVYDGDQVDAQNATDKKDFEFSSTTPWNYLATALNTTSERKQAYIKLSDKVKHTLISDFLINYKN